MSRRPEHESHGAPLERDGELRRRRQISGLLVVAQAVARTLELDQVLDTIAREMRRVIECDECTVWLYDADERLLRPVAMDYDSFTEETLSVRLALGEGLTGWVALHREGAIAHDSRVDPRVVHIPGTPREASTMMSVPLVARDEVLGAITLEVQGVGAFQPEDLELAQLFAGQCSAAIANARLYADARRAVEELRQAQAQLVQSAKLNALGELAGGVAHGFNNVLAAITGHAQLLAHEIEAPRSRARLRVIEQAASDGARIVRRVQQFSGVRPDEPFAVLDTGDVLRDVVDMTRPLLERRIAEGRPAIEVVLDASATRRVAGSAADLREALLNLLLNGVDAMPDGGRLTLSSRDDGTHVVLAVSDTGVGMDAAVQARLFEPFFTTKGVRGTGLGLSVAYGIVKRHGGTIDVRTAPGDGTEIRLRVPAATEPSEAMPAAAAPSPPDRALRVLVADDEPDVLDVICEMLQAAGHAVTPAAGGPAALGALDQGPFDVVLTDLGMPDVTGWEIAAAARARHPETHVVLCTGWGAQLDSLEVRARGVEAVLTKPFSLDELDRAIRPDAARRAA